MSLVRRWLIILVGMLVLVGCTPTTVKPPPAAVETAVIAEANPDPTHTPILPTPPPTATAVPEPTNSPTPEPTLTSEPTETAVPDVPRFAVAEQIAIFGTEAAVPNDNIGDSGKQFTDPGGVLFHDGQFHMFHNAFTGWPAAVDVMYSVSDDGLNWELGQETPVFEGEDLMYVGVAALASSVIVREDGTWMLYFYTWEDRTWPVSESKIGVATAPGPLGPWTASTRPILTPGPAGEWDELAVRTPSVVQTEDGFVMFYSGHQANSASIGQAFSEDGLNWTKFDDPTTTAAPFAKSDPIFEGSGVGWDKNHVYQPRVHQPEDGGWVMLYTSANAVGGSTLFQSHGLAVSPDGSEWTRSETVVFTPEEVNSSGRNIWFTELVYGLDSYFIYFELGQGSETEIYVATFDAGILP